MPKVPPPVEHQFKKGNKGKPKGAINIKTRMIKALLKKVEYPDLSKEKDNNGQYPKITGQVIDYMISSLIQLAIKGNTKAFEILIERTEGTVKQQIETDEEFEPIEKILIQIVDQNGEVKNLN
jgi:hypothetical protein